MPSVLIESSSIAYESLFSGNEWKLLEDLTWDKPSFVLFTGGEDVNPMLYDEEQHPTTFFNQYRDLFNAHLFSSCKANSIPMVGICRGGQFLNVMNSGKMYQHVDNHGGIHNMTRADTKEVIPVSSTHHQMMIPADGAEILGFATESTRRERMEKGEIVVESGEHIDPEVVYYPDTKSLCFQPHPEFFGVPECTNYFFELLEQKGFI